MTTIVNIGYPLPNHKRLKVTQQDYVNGEWKDAPWEAMILSPEKLEERVYVYKERRIVITEVDE